MNDARAKIFRPITLPGEYALRAMIVLACDHRRSTAAELAKVTGIPAGYLAKVLQQLAKSGLVDAKRGTRGGFSLAREASRIRLMDLLAALGAIPDRLRCPTTGAPCDGRCPLHESLRRAMQTLDEVLEQTTLDMLVRPPGVEPRTQNGEANPR